MQLLPLLTAILRMQTCVAWRYFLADLKFIGSSQSDYKSLRIYSGANNTLETKYFNVTKPSVLIIHGWKDSFKSESASTLINAFLTRSDYNIIFGDWKSSAGSYDYSAVVGSIGEVANIFRIILKKLESSYDLSKIYIVGHSLGAQIAGRIGNGLKSDSIIIKRITGLDPAGPLFKNTNSELFGFPIPIFIGRQIFELWIERHLNKNDAHFVDIIHTNAGRAGTFHQLGHLDFWPNGGQTQFCCKQNSIYCSICSHSAAWKLYAESVISTESKFMAIKCPKNGIIFTKKECVGPEMANMGFYASKDSKHGNYFLEVN